MTARLGLVLSMAALWAALLPFVPARAELPTTPEAPATMSPTEVKPPPNVTARPAKEGWDRIANFEGQTDSDCIGDPRTARCALDTYVACLARGVYDLCNLSRTPTPEAQVTQPRTVDYAIRRLGGFSQSDLPRNLNVRWSSGTPDEQLAVIDLRQCDFADGKWACKTLSAQPGRYLYLLRTGSTWSVAGVREPGDEQQKQQQAATPPAAPQAAAPAPAPGSAGVPLPARPAPTQALAGAAGVIASGLPQPGALPARPDPKWKRITNFGAETQTDCIGNPKNPTCALETFIACLAYRDGDLCAIAENYPDLRIEFDSPERRRVMDYHIRSLGPFKATSIPKTMNVQWAPVAGDQLAVVDIRECQLLETGWACRPFTGPNGHFFFLKPVAGRWYVKDSFEPSPPGAPPAAAQTPAPATQPGTPPAAAPPQAAAVQPPAPQPPAAAPKPGAAGAPVPLMPAAPSAQAAPAPAPTQPSVPAQPQPAPRPAQPTATAPPAIAELVGLPARPDAAWRRVTNFGLGTDSKCIGVPRSAECVMDTYVACLARRDGGLCALAENFPRTVAPAAAQTERRFMDYRLRQLRTFAAAELPPALQQKWTPATGDLLAVLDARECDEKGGKWDCRAVTGSGGRLFHLRAFDGRWYVKDSFEP